MSTAIVEERSVPAGDAPLYEVVDGQRVELQPMSTYESVIASELGYLLRQFAKLHPLGRVVVETLFLLPQVDRQRRPDVAFVSYQRWPRQRRVPRTEAWPVAPDLAVEVVSRSNEAEDVLTKVMEYFRAGVQQVWVVWPRNEQVHVWETPTQVRVLTTADVLQGEPLLPGLRLPIADLFEPAEMEDGPDQAAPPQSNGV